MNIAQQYVPVLGDMALARQCLLEQLANGVCKCPVCACAG